MQRSNKEWHGLCAPYVLHMCSICAPYVLHMCSPCHLDVACVPNQILLVTLCARFMFVYPIEDKKTTSLSSPGPQNFRLRPERHPNAESLGCADPHLEEGHAMALGPPGLEILVRGLDPEMGLTAVSSSHLKECLKTNWIKLQHSREMPRELLGNLLRSSNSKAEKVTADHLVWMGKPGGILWQVASLHNWPAWPELKCIPSLSRFIAIRSLPSLRGLMKTKRLILQYFSGPSCCGSSFLGSLLFSLQTIILTPATPTTHISDFSAAECQEVVSSIAVYTWI